MIFHAGRVAERGFLFDSYSFCCDMPMGVLWDFYDMGVRLNSYGLPMGFLWVSYGFLWVSYGFPLGSLWPPAGFPMGFLRVSYGMPRGSYRIIVGFLLDSDGFIRQTNNK